MKQALELTVVSHGPSTVYDRAEEYIQSHYAKAPAKSREAATHYLQVFCQYTTKHGMTPESLDNYGNYLYSRGLGNVSAKNYCVTVRAFLRWCFRMGHTQKAWHEFLPKLNPVVYQPPKIITHAEYLRLREACKEDRDKDWILVLAYHTGLRMGDCCHLKWSQIDRTTQVIKAVPRKTEFRTGKPVYLPYLSGSDLHTLIEQRWADREREPYTGTDFVCPVFATYYGDNNQSVTHIFRKVFAKAGLKGYSFKHLRSTFETNLANSGVNLAVAMAMTGRSNTDQLARYVRVDHAAARDAIGRAMEQAQRE